MREWLTRAKSFESPPPWELDMMAAIPGLLYNGGNRDPSASRGLSSAPRSAGLAGWSGSLNWLSPPRRSGGDGAESRDRTVVDYQDCCPSRPAGKSAQGSTAGCVGGWCNDPMARDHGWRRDAADASWRGARAGSHARRRAAPVGQSRGRRDRGEGGLGRSYRRVSVVGVGVDVGGPDGARVWLGDRK